MKIVKNIKKEPKKMVCIRLDPEVLAWFKRQGPGYQTHINKVLKLYAGARL
jgi:uncharacterized protein (DUF4415 family)